MMVLMLIPRCPSEPCPYRQPEIHYVESNQRKGGRSPWAKITEMVEPLAPCSWRAISMALAAGTKRIFLTCLPRLFAGDGAALGAFWIVMLDHEPDGAAGTLRSSHGRNGEGHHDRAQGAGEGKGPPSGLAQPLPSQAMRHRAVASHAAPPSGSDDPAVQLLLVRASAVD